MGMRTMGITALAPGRLGVVLGTTLPAKRRRLPLALPQRRCQFLFQLAHPHLQPGYHLLQFPTTPALRDRINAGFHALSLTSLIPPA